MLLLANTIRFSAAIHLENRHYSYHLLSFKNVGNFSSPSSTIGAKNLFVNACASSWAGANLPENDFITNEIF